MRDAAVRPPKALQDQEARDVVAQALDINVMVLAGAGAGKTTSLIKRMVAVVRSGVCEVENLAAITFTRKAAGEMRGRFFVRLRSEASRATNVGEAQRIQKALEQIDRCFIGTIHAFCSRLLRERPLEAGLVPDYQEIEGRDEAVFRRRAWDGFLQERYASADPRLKQLAERGVALEDVYHFFGRRCEHVDLPLKPTSTPAPDMRKALADLDAFVARIAKVMPDASRPWDALMRTVRNTRYFIDHHGIRHDGDVARLLFPFESPGMVCVTLKRWGNPVLAKNIRDDWLPGFQESVVKPVLRQWHEGVYGLVADFVNDAAARYGQQRREEGKTTFQDLLLHTADLLEDNPEVRTFFQRRHRTLFVDEFQDTDPIQARIVFYLTGQDVQERDWRKLVPRPGSLFLVGDDKQSIYRFRRADIEIFRFVATRIEATGGRVVGFNTNFRSLGKLCRWFSHTLSSLFSSESLPYQAPFESLHGYRESGADGFYLRTIDVPKQPRHNRAQVAKHDAKVVAAFIAAAMRGETAWNEEGNDNGGSLGVRASPGDFMILTRTRRMLPIYARALEEQGIPFDIVGGGRLGDSEEVKAIVAMLEAVHRPENPVPFVAYLRGPLAGFTDGELYDYSRLGGRFNWRASTSKPDDLPESLHRRVEQAKSLLAEALKDLRTFPPSAALERILERCGYLAFSSVHPDGEASSRGGNLVCLLSLVRELAARGWSWGRVVEELRDLIDDEEYQVDQMTLESGREDVVRVMNLHQAKGLEARVVFLVDPCDKSSPQGPTSHVSRAGDAPYLSMVVRKSARGPVIAQPAGWNEDEREERRFVCAEEVRLLYVAATRARDLLVVSVYEYAQSTKKGPWVPLYASLANVPALEVDAAEQPGWPAITAAEFQAHRTRMEERLNRSREPTYRVGSVIELTGTPERTAPGDAALAVASVGGFRRPAVRMLRGADYGSLIHLLFDEAVRGVLPDRAEDRERYVQAQALEAGLSGEVVDDAVAAVERFRTSLLWERIQRADTCYTEVSVGVLDADGDLPCVVEGQIDLVYRDEGGWHVVDYKTDPASTQAEEDALYVKYGPQLEAYRECWQRLAGEPVADAKLWLVHGGGA